MTDDDLLARLRTRLEEGVHFSDVVLTRLEKESISGRRHFVTARVLRGGSPEALAAHARGDIQLPPPPVPLDRIEEAEALLGFPLPTLLRRIYLELCNGGIGPGNGILPLIGDGIGMSSDTLLSSYAGWREAGRKDPEWAWPERLLLLCDWGCAIYSCVDCAGGEERMLGCDCNLGDTLRDCLLPEGYSFTGWLEAWLGGTLRQSGIV